MAKVSTILIAPELKQLQQKMLEPGDRFILGSIQGHKALPSKNQKRALSRVANISSPQVGRGSMFKYFSTYWRALDSSQKEIWRVAGAVSGLSGWQLFVSDNAQRVKNNLTVGVPASTFFQVRVGVITIGAPANEIKLKQSHPEFYNVQGKEVGRAWRKTIVTINENFSLPLTLRLRYKSNLTISGGEQTATFHALIKTSYQGQDVFYNMGINLLPNTDWIDDNIIINNLRGIMIEYNLYIHIKGYTGEFRFDNIIAEHSATNWLRDTRCDEIDKKFKRQFASIKDIWEPELLPTGAQYNSRYYAL